METTLSDDTERPVETLAESVVDLDEVTTDAESEATEKPEEAEKPDQEEQTEKKKLSGAKKAKRRETFLLNQLAERDRLLEEARKQAPQASEASEEKPPREEDFNGDFFAFQQAMTAFKAGKAAQDAISKAFRDKELSERQTRLQTVEQERRMAHLERVEDAKDIIADFDEVMEGMKGVNVRQELIDAIIESDNSAALSYHLAKNKSELDQLNNLSGKELARALGRLESKVELPKAKKQTSAPPPVTPLRGGASGSFDPEGSSMDEYVAKRKAGWNGR